MWWVVESDQIFLSNLVINYLLFSVLGDEAGWLPPGILPPMVAMFMFQASARQHTWWANWRLGRLGKGCLRGWKADPSGLLWFQLRLILRPLIARQDAHLKCPSTQRWKRLFRILAALASLRYPLVLIISIYITAVRPMITTRGYIVIIVIMIMIIYITGNGSIWFH